MDRPLHSITPGKVFYKDLWENQMLFWAVVLGSITVPVCIYVPALNIKVFYQAPIGWEWGIIVGLSIFFMIASLLWKLFVRSKDWYKNLGKVPEADGENDL
ncbi:hypothetical protein MPER_08740 [Moniliophthora perniciosa FA553]|nr:hypothetical protein MPER_08740 [Moniliophthora perniciosa FA553]